MDRSNESEIIDPFYLPISAESHEKSGNCEKNVVLMHLSGGSLVMRALCAQRIPLPMKKSLRLLVFSGMLAVLASPVFADSGPGGGGNPPPPPQTGNSALTPSGSTSTTSSTSTTGTITTIVNEIESVLGAVL